MYYLTEVVKVSFEEAVTLITEALKTQGFGVLTEIDVQGAFKKKINEDFRRYIILGACHPRIAYQILQADDKGGTLYPCNVVVQEWEDGRVEVSAIKPNAMFHHLDNPQVKEIAEHATKLMELVMETFAKTAQEKTLALAS
jgi:uncharacterized protein (DUF302 family)